MKYTRNETVISVEMLWQSLAYCMIFRLILESRMVGRGYLIKLGIELNACDLRGTFKITQEHPSRRIFL